MSNQKILIEYNLIFEEIKEYYLYICWNPLKGFCGIARMAYTVGLFYNFSMTGYEGRYCYGTMVEAVEALKNWDGIGDAPGDWIKHKGLLEYHHPNSTDPFAIKKPK